MNNDAKMSIFPVLLGSVVNPKDSRRIKASSVFFLSTLSFSEKFKNKQLLPVIPKEKEDKLLQEDGSQVDNVRHLTYNDLVYMSKLGTILHSIGI